MQGPCSAMTILQLPVHFLAPIQIPRSSGPPSAPWTQMAVYVLGAEKDWRHAAVCIHDTLLLSHFRYCPLVQYHFRALQLVVLFLSRQPFQKEKNHFFIWQNHILHFQVIQMNAQGGY